MTTDRLLTASEAAAYLNVPAARVRAWKTRGELHPRGLVPGRGAKGGQPVYSLDDLRPLVDAYRARTRPASG